MTGGTDSAQTQNSELNSLGVHWNSIGVYVRIGIMAIMGYGAPASSLPGENWGPGLKPRHCGGRRDGRGHPSIGGAAHGVCGHTLVRGWGLGPPKKC